MIEIFFNLGPNELKFFLKICFLVINNVSLDDVGSS